MAIGSGQVLGGTAQPRFALIGEQLIDNGDFNVNTTGWSLSGAGTITRTADVYAPWGDYSLEVYDNSAGFAYAKVDAEMTTGVQYIGSAWFRRHASNSDNAYIEIREPDSGVTYKSWGTAKWTGYADEQYNVLTVLSPVSSGVGTGELHIYPIGDTPASTGKCYVKRVRMWPVLKLYDDGPGAARTDPTYLPSKIEHSWTPVFKHRHQNAGGAMSQELKGYRYQVTFAYPLARDLYAQQIAEMASGRTLFLWPHFDPDNGIFFGLPVRCVGDVVLNYPQKGSGGDGYIGRVMALTFRSLDLVPTIPPELV